MEIKKVIAVVLGLVLVIGLGVAVYIVQNPQILKSRAYQDVGGEAQFAFSPTAKTSVANTDFEIAVTLDTNGKPINSFGFQISYPSDAADFTFKSIRPATGWSMAQANQKKDTAGTKELITFAATQSDSSGTGISYSTPTTVATIVLSGSSATTKTLSFVVGPTGDVAARSRTTAIMVDADGNTNDLLIKPTSTATVTITGGTTTTTKYICVNNSCQRDDTATGTTYSTLDACNTACGGTSTTCTSSSQCANDKVCTNGACVSACSAGTTNINICKTYTPHTCTLVNVSNGSVCTSNGTSGTCQNGVCTVGQTNVTPTPTPAITTRYKCSGSSCILASAGDTNTYTTSNCNNSCVVNAPKYRCSSNGTCMRDDVSGNYTDASSCNSYCATTVTTTPPTSTTTTTTTTTPTTQTTLPQTGTIGNTLLLGGIGGALILGAVLMLVL